MASLPIVYYFGNWRYPPFIYLVPTGINIRKFGSAGNKSYLSQWAPSAARRRISPSGWSGRSRCLIIKAGLTFWHTQTVCVDALTQCCWFNYALCYWHHLKASESFIAKFIKNLGSRRAWQHCLRTAGVEKLLSSNHSFNWNNGPHTATIMLARALPAWWRWRISVLLFCWQARLAMTDPEWSALLVAAYELHRYRDWQHSTQDWLSVSTE